MIISDLNYLESVNEEAGVSGGFLNPIRYTSDVRFYGSVASHIYLTPFSSSAAAEADSAAAPFFVGGSSFTQTSTYTATGRASGIPGVIVGSVSSSTSASASQG